MKPTTASMDLKFSDSFVLKDNGLEIIGEPTFEQWLEVGQFIRKAKGAVHFWIGDWIRYGEGKWGERYKQAIEETGFDYGTLRNDKWVASQIPAERRKSELSFDHHYAVANLDEEEQTELLDKAAEEKIPTKQFRKVVEQNNNLSRRHDNQQKAESIQQAESVQQVANAAGIVKTIKDQAVVLIANIDECKFDELPAPVLADLLKSLDKVRDRIAEVEIKYGN